MTRETKLGLVVAGSFLALVGGVVAVRLRQADAPAGEAEMAQAQPAESPPASPPQPEKPRTNPVPSDALVHADANKMPNTVPAPAPEVAPVAAVTPPAAVTMPNPSEPARRRRRRLQPFLLRS